MTGKLDDLVAFLDQIPATRMISRGGARGKPWWIKLNIDIEHRLAWNVVQELGHVLNYLSLEERLPTSFKPVSPPPYVNGGPKEFLSWTIEADSAEVEPGEIRRWLEGRMPRPVDDLAQWDEGADDADDDRG